MLDLRRSSGLSIEEAARLIGIAVEKLSDWEKGKGLPSEIYAGPISVIYRVSRKDWLEILEFEKKAK